MDYYRVRHPRHTGPPLVTHRAQIPGCCRRVGLGFSPELRIVFDPTFKNEVKVGHLGFLNAMARLEGFLAVCSHDVISGGRYLLILHAHIPVVPA